MVKRALITGITGQDGSYLAELLLSKGYEVHGVIRRASTFNTHRIDHLYIDPHVAGARLFMHYGELVDGSRMAALLSQVQPNEVYHLAAQSHVRVSFDEPEYTSETTGLGTIRLLEAIRQVGLDCRFYQASSCEMFGSTPPPQNENTPFHPRSPYGTSKVFAYWTARNYREAYGLFTVNGILFNHESPRRGETFVTRKITRAVARIQAGLDRHLWMGYIDAVRDWGYAPEYVEGMWRMMQVDTPDDYVLATGVGHSVRELLALAFDHVGLDWEKYVRFDERYLRPAEVEAVVGDASKANTTLGWKAHVQMPELVKIMVEADIKALENSGPTWIDRPDLPSWRLNPD
ncbi:MAG: GDP-mannose 4,6-dehydratase [Actinobacteria bacterium]|nr:GDP-mannose 4,6-dehydratase [Actinomycetota bacterium]